MVERPILKAHSSANNKRAFLRMAAVAAINQSKVRSAEQKSSDTAFGKGTYICTVIHMYVHSSLKGTKLGQG
jgi:hypothetical protein